MTKQVLIDEDKLKMVWAALKSYQGFIDDAHIIEGQWHWLNDTKEAIKALEEALAKQEPVGYFKKEGDVWYQYYEDYPNADELTALYTHPQPKREPLTDEQIEVICMGLWSGGWRQKAMADFARAIESAHGIKGEA